MKLVLLVTLVFLSTIPLRAQAEEDEEIFPDLAFFVGEYTLIGKVLDGDATFLGRLVLRIDEQGAGVFERHIGGSVTRGSWGIEFAIGNEVRVLRLRWNNDGRSFECTYQWCMDFDVYPRLSGHCYASGMGTDSPGMEVGFIRHCERDGEE
jgi:hypothetical protein